MENIKIHIDSRQDGDFLHAMVILEGELCIANASELHHSLSGILSENDHVNIIIREVSRLDLSCLQILYAAVKLAKRLDKKLAIDFELPDDLEMLVHKTGFGGLFKGEKP